ncbi:hypothetical protein HELRODRAFT_177702 [Helobdella robusta]|uniref:Endonuclease/exonuclease/phosphatase domain-containing protein n=1 Tax=Helobdella robusta TaxID=6412 RepID=T1FC38_HELRO|nr:hypothetical protein HELRODRAFT_177702 [Helobdella robusta]ESN97647.1 hypothetical protein HELRODRAFT_177702 [Helobdella robusta]
MAARPVVISEVLYFLVGNFDLFDNETFINNTAEFFSNEDFIDAQKILKLELENVKIEKFEKPTSRGNTRRDKLLVLTQILIFLKEEKLMDKCSIFASVNLSNVPNFENVIKINFEILKNELKNMLYTQHNKLIQTLDVHTQDITSLKNKLVQTIDVHTHDMSALNNKINCLSYNKDKNTSKLNINSVPSAVNSDMNKQAVTSKPAMFWSDEITTPTDDNPLPYSVVVRNKKSARTNNSPVANQVNPNDQSSLKGNPPNQPNKIIGLKKCATDKLCAEKIIVKKSVFAMSNVKKCSRSKVVEYLSDIGINVLSCFPVSKLSTVPPGTTLNNDDIESTMFRVCVNTADATKMQDPDNMPEDYNFLFKNRSNKKGGGVGIFLKLGLDYTLFDNALSTDDVADCLCIEIKFHKSNVIVFAIYRPPNSDPSNLIQKLDLALSSLKTNSKVYLVGDFNLDLSKACSDKLVASFSDLLASFNFVPLISQPTRVTHSSSSIIDNIFTSNLSHHISGIL